MSYTLTDDDYNDLDTVKNQLGLLSSLTMKKGDVTIDHEELCSMFCALREPLVKVLKLVEERHKVHFQPLSSL